MPLVVRRATPAEASLAAGLWHRAEAARTGITPSAADAHDVTAGLVEAVGKPGAMLLVALDDERIVGTGYGVRLRTDARAAQVAMLAVEPDRWGQGIGSALLRALMQQLAAAGCERLRMNVVATNDRARAVYERHGWTHDGEVERVAAGAAPELVYRFPGASVAE